MITTCSPIAWLSAASSRLTHRKAARACLTNGGHIKDGVMITPCDGHKTSSSDREGLQ